MKLYLAVAVLMLALVAYTEAQEEDQSYAKIRDQFTEFGKTVAEKAKTTFETIQTSEFAETTRNWFSTQFENLKTKFAELNKDN